jgi:hypothetical protein
MQAESWTDGDDQNKSKSKPTLRQVIRYTIATQGWKACFAGLAPTLIRYVFSLRTWTKLMNRAMPVCCFRTRWEVWPAANDRWIWLHFLHLKLAFRHYQNSIIAWVLVIHNLIAWIHCRLHLLSRHSIVGEPGLQARVGDRNGADNFRRYLKRLQRW